MKRHEWTFGHLIGAAMLSASLLSGCSTFTTTQSDASFDPTTGQPVRQVTTEAKARTLWDSKSALANFKATQTDKSQSASVGSLNQEASATNVVGLVESIARGVAAGLK